MKNAEGGSQESHEFVRDIQPTIRLEIFRHDQPAPAAPGEKDEQRRLTPQGREHAQQVGKEKKPLVSMGLAYASPRDRAQETAYRQLLANESFTGAEASLDDLKAAVEKALPFGNKLIVSENLNYQVSHNPEFAKAWGVAYNEGRLLAFLLEQSDAVARENNDLADYSYSRSAANVAEIVKKYVGIEPVWQRVYGQNEQKYQANTEMQRFLGTHQSIGETFLLKVIEKTQGRDAALKFIEQLPNKNGFDVSEGFSVNIAPSADEVKVTITYGSTSWDLTREVLDEIVQDREQLDKEINDQLRSVRHAHQALQ